MKRAVLKGSCPLIDGEKMRGRVAYDLWPSIAEAPEDGFEYRGTVHSEDPEAGAALIDLFGRDATMSLAFQDRSRLDIVAMMHVFRGARARARSRPSAGDRSTARANGRSDADDSEIGRLTSTDIHHY